MYEKILNYFETNLCMENIYFRKNYKKWIIGLVLTLLFELASNYALSILISNIWVRSVIIILFDFIITILFLVFIYIIPLKKIYRKQVNTETKIDRIGLLMKEESLSAYREIEIKQMEKFLKNKCNIKKVECINSIIEMLNEEINEHYKGKNFIEKYFNNTILPIITLILTVYFTNNNMQQLTEIVAKTIVSIASILLVIYFIQRIRNINITPVNKKDNLIELKRILNDIKIKWSR